MIAPAVGALFTVARLTVPWTRHASSSASLERLSKVQPLGNAIDEEIEHFVSGQIALGECLIAVHSRSHSSARFY
jgi:hypothetical protein